MIKNSRFRREAEPRTEKCAEWIGILFFDRVLTLRLTLALRLSREWSGAWGQKTGSLPLIKGQG